MTFLRPPRPVRRQDAGDSLRGRLEGPRSRTRSDWESRRIYVCPRCNIYTERLTNTASALHVLPSLHECIHSLQSIPIHPSGHNDAYLTRSHWTFPPHSSARRHEANSTRFPMLSCTKEASGLLFGLPAEPVSGRQTAAATTSHVLRTPRRPEMVKLRAPI